MTDRILFPALKGYFQSKPSIKSRLTFPHKPPFFLVSRKSQNYSLV